MCISYIGTFTVTLRGRSPLPWTSTVMTQASPEGCTDRSCPPVFSTTWAAASLQSDFARATSVGVVTGNAADPAIMARIAATLKDDAMLINFHGDKNLRR